MKIQAISTRPAQPDVAPFSELTGVQLAGEDLEGLAAPAGEWVRRPVAPGELGEALRAWDGLTVFFVEAEGDNQALYQVLKKGLETEDKGQGASTYFIVSGLGEDEELARRLYACGVDEVHQAPVSQALLDARLDAISRRYQQLGALQHVSRQLEDAQELGNLGYWYCVFKTGHCWWSPHLYRVYDRDPAPRPVDVEEQFGFVHPDERALARQKFEASIRTGEPYDYICRVRTREGSFRPIQVRCRPLRDRDGEVVAMEGVVQNVENRRGAADRLRQQKKILGYISDYLPGALYQVRLTSDHELWLDYVSLGSLAHFDHLKAFVGQKLHASPVRIFEEDLAGVIESGQKAVNAMEPWVDEFRVYDDQDRIRWVAGRSSPERDDDGATVWRGVMLDITERKLLTEQVQRADRLTTIGTMAAGIAHEINNPLVSVLGYLQLGLRALDKDGKNEANGQGQMHRTLSAAMDGAQRIKVIVEDLMSFGRSAPERNEMVDLRQVSQSAVRMLSNQLHPIAKVECDFEEVPPVPANSGHLRQVLVNLLLNAAQAMSKSNRAQNEIGLVLYARDAKAYIEVRDNGRGIQPSDMQRLFEPFFSTKPAGEGAGLGLYVCKNIIESMGGTIDVESTPGEGTTFTVSLKTHRT